jgi:hypothetical protein
MKIRTGFVANSSSCSFVTALGAIKKADIDVFKTKLNKFHKDFGLTDEEIKEGKRTIVSLETVKDKLAYKHKYEGHSDDSLIYLDTSNNGYDHLTVDTETLDPEDYIVSVDIASEALMNRLEQLFKEPEVLQSDTNMYIGYDG